jgi:hypothetical protein
MSNLACHEYFIYRIISSGCLNSYRIVNCGDFYDLLLKKHLYNIIVRFLLICMPCGQESIFNRIIYFFLLSCPVKRLAGAG